MFELIDYFGIVILVACLSGAVCGVTGAFVVGMRMPFLAVCCAHLALAGAVWGLHAGGNELPGAFAGATIGTLLAAWLLRRPATDTNAVFGVLFSASMGIALLGVHHGDGSKSESLSLLWGNLLFAGTAEAVILGIVLILLIACIALFEQQLKLVVFSRDLAALLVPEALIFAAILGAITLTIAVNLSLIGGLMLFSLICNPAAAALAVARSFRSALVLSTLAGVVCALAGFALAYVLNWPAGASIAIVSAVPFLFANLFHKHH